MKFTNNNSVFFINPVPLCDELTGNPLDKFAYFWEYFVKMRLSYNGYYPSLPSWRRGFDSHQPL